MNENRKHLIAKLARSLASLKLTVITLLLLALLVVGGTVYQAANGIYAAQRDVFDSWLIWVAGFIPLPGMLLASSLLFINLLAAAFFRLRYRWRRAGLLLIHFGLLLMIGGGFFIAVTAKEYLLTLGEGESSRFALSSRDGSARTLPIEIKLIDFQKAMHPGTEIPSSFSSRIEIAGDGVRRQAVIAMNRPLRYRSYAFYQSSYAEDGRGRESSTFSVVRSSGRWLPYLASALVFLGLAGHFLVMLAAALKKSTPEVRL